MCVQIVDHQESIAVISSEATQEAALESLLGRVSDKWRNIEFVVNPYKEYKDTYILGGVDDVQAALQDSVLTMSTILASRYVTGIR